MALSQQQKHETFKTAYDTYKKHRENQNYIGAFVVAYSVLEDRITAAFVLAHQVKGLKCPPKPERKNFQEKISKLHTEKFLDDECAKCYKDSATTRNQKIHAAIWNLNEFSAEDCEKVIRLAREADKLSRKLKKLAKENEPKPL